MSKNWIDDVLRDSFPASDPPSWIPGAATPAPAVAGTDGNASHEHKFKDGHTELSRRLHAKQCEIN